MPRVKKNLWGYVTGFLVIIISTLVFFFLYLKVDEFVTNLTVKNIEIIGASNKIKVILEKDLKNLIDEKISQVNLLKLKQKLLTKSWFKNVSVYRSYPNTIKVKVIEIQPLFIWENDDEEFFLINSENIIQRRAKVSDYKKYIIIYGGSEALKESDEIRFIIYKHRDLLKNIQSLSFKGYRWDIKLNNDITIMLPENNLSNALDRITEANNKYDVLSKDIKYIDARVPSKLLIMPNVGKQDEKNS